jgi:uncharacterized protein with HEPN domain
MSFRQWQDSLRDILDAVAEINVFTEGMDFDTFRGDQKTLRAVEMNFIIIGEAAASVPDEIEKRHPEIPWNLMRGMRSTLIADSISVYRVTPAPQRPAASTSAASATAV